MSSKINVRRGVVGALAALSAGAWTFGAVQAVAAAPDGTAGQAALASQTYQNQATRLCMDDTSQGFRHWKCNGTNPQKWIVTAPTPGTRQFRNVNTGRCMDDSDRGLRTVGCHGGTTQRWTITHWNDGTIRFRNYATGRCISDSWTNLRPAACNSSEAQSWF